MQKIKVRKDVAEQVTSKLQANKNIFTRGDFDEYKISDEELKDLESRHYFSESELRKKGERLSKIYEKICKDTGLTMSEVVNCYGITDDDCYYDLQNPTEKFYYDLKMQFAKADDEVEKSYTKREFVRGNGKRKDYWRVRNYEGVEGEKQNKKKRIPESLITKDVKKLHEYIIKYRNQMSKKDKNDIDLVIKSGNWAKVKTQNGKIIKVDKQKWYDMEAEPLQWEIENASVLADRGFNVYLPKEIHNIQHYKNVDAIVNGVKIEFRYINTNNEKTLQGKYREKLEQNPHISIHFNEKAKQSPDVYWNKLNGTQSSQPKGILICYYENTKEFKVYDYDMQIKKAALSAALYRPEITPPTYKNITQQNNLSSKNVIKSLTYSGHKLQGRTRLYGMDISIENKKGSYRSGVDKDGHKWRVLMHNDYGYIRGTVGVDKDHLDCYVGSDKNANKVYVIHQNDPVTHKYDEDKCMLCFSSAADAKAAYMKQYDRPGFYGSMTTMTIDQFKSFVFSHKGQMIHKSFDINITDITENNKQQKLEQVNKALNAIANNQPFMIKHIPADASTNYGNLLVKIRDFDKSKIEKAVHKIALSLDADISGASKGEAFVYKAQEEIVDKYFKEFTNRTRAVYNFVISYFDLPDIRIVSKAGELRHKGKILYNPETGKPIQESEWKRFIVELEKFLNRNYTGIGEKIVLSAESLGIILDRLSKTNSLEAIRKMSVSDLKAKRYDVDWIGESIKNMKDKFGDVISRERQARIQIAMDSAAQRVTKVKDDIRNNIQQIIIDGIRDKQSKSVVAQNLFDKCASLNRDMQRIADTEVQMATSRAYIKEEVYNTPKDEKVYFKRFEMIDDNTCKKCRKINGKVVLWSDVALPDEHIKDEFADIAIWEGKTEGDYPESVLHPFCRGCWIRYYPEV